MSKIHKHIQAHMKKSSKEWSRSSHKRDEDEISSSPLDNGVSSDEEPSEGDSPAGEDDCESSGRSVTEKVSEDESDWNSD